MMMMRMRMRMMMLIVIRDALTIVKVVSSELKSHCYYNILIEPLLL